MRSLVALRSDQGCQHELSRWARNSINIFMIYLPEYHTFEHSAIVPWPVDPRHYQKDWIDSIDMIESWLEQYVGDHWVKWAYSTAVEQEYWQACIAFKQARDCTLFLLTWS